MSNNDTSTLNGALQELGETMADNLVSMGVVDADASDGLTTLAGKILTIEPSIGGLDLDTAITLTSSSASITLGGSVVLTSKLTASYDDETLVNVDLEGVLTGATVSFMNGNTVIGTGVTDVNGIATYTYTPAATGTLSLKAVFAGTDNFDDCESSTVTVSVIVPVPDSITVSSDKSVLSYYDSESATVSATVLDANNVPCSGETVEFFNGATSMGTAVTNASGVATKSYSSTGAGDVSFTAEVGSLVSETYSIEDITYYNSGASVGSLEIGSNVSCTSNGSYITITTNTSGEKDVKIPVTLSGDWQFETTLAELGTTNDLTFKVGSGNQWGVVSHDTGKVGVNLGSGTQYFSKSITAGSILKITYITGTMSVYWNNELLKSSPVTVSGKMGYYTNSGRVQKIKNIKLKLSC